MNIDEARGIYSEKAGKAGRKSAKWKEAEALMIKSGELDLSADPADDTCKKKGFVMAIIDNPLSIPRQRKIDIYREALSYIGDKRNFSFDAYLLGTYGITKSVCNEWENDSDILNIRTIANEFIEQKYIDAGSDKWGSVNPLFALFMLKSAYGYNDKGDSSFISAEGVIEIGMAKDIDTSSMNYADEDGRDEE